MEPLDYRAWGNTAKIFRMRDREVLFSGPAGTGKTIACLWKLHLAALKYPGMRGLMVRKTLVSLTASAMVTYLEKVLGSHKDNFRIIPFGGSKIHPAGFRYPNGSVITIGGLDFADKIKSTEYDMIYVNEATELAIDDWEMLITRRKRAPIMPYTQLLADCNPAAPTHWLYQRILNGQVQQVIGVHEDNPSLYDEDAGEWTPVGVDYLGGLQELTGVRRQRMYEGIWAAAEGLVYENWDPSLHMIDPFPIPERWPRYHAVDFGYTNPFVYQFWAQDPDGRLILYRELYMTKRLVSEHAKQVLALMGGEPKPGDIVTDHDAEDRATLEKELGMRTTAAVKNVSAGIQAVANRLNKAGDGKPRIQIMRGCTVEIDRELQRLGKPTSTADEFVSYVWDTRQNRAKGEQPMKENDHGMDTLRYRVAAFDLKHRPKVAAVAMPQVSTWG